MNRLFVTALTMLLTSLAARPSVAGDSVVLATQGMVRCEVCEAQVRRRVAVMPVNVGELPGRVAISPAAAAERVRGQIEARLASSPYLIAVNRANLDAVLSEQKLAASGAASVGGRPVAGRIVSAQLLLFTTIEGLDLKQRSDRSTSDGMGSYAQEAGDLDAEAARAEDRLADLDAQSGLLVAGGESAVTGAAASFIDLAGRVESERARRLRAQADEVRSRARVEAVKTIDEQEKIEVVVRFGWRAVDVTTGTVTAQGSVVARDQGERKAHATQSAAGSESSAEETPDSVIVNHAVDRAVIRLASQIEGQLANEPFKAKVAAVRGEEVVINAGTDLGVRPGDLFGVRRVQSSIVDPDTGLPLALEAEPVGAIRVERVLAGAAYGRILQGVGEVHPADELQWVGVMVASSELPRLKEEAAMRSRERARRREMLAEESAPTRTAAEGLFQKYKRQSTPELIDELIDRRGEE